MPPKILLGPPSTSPLNSGDPIDTGTGGFPIDGQRYTYDTGAKDEENRPQWSSGQVNVDVSEKDLPTSTKRTLASYLSQTTLGKTPSSGAEGVPNKYTVDPPNPLFGAKNLTLKNPQTKLPTPPTQSSNTSAFAKDIIPGDQRSPAYNNLKTFSKNIDGKTLKDYVTGGISKGSQGNRNGFTPAFPSSGVSGDEDSPISAYYGNSTSQVSNSMIYNRFNPDLKYSDYSVLGSPEVDGPPQLSMPQFAVKYDMGRSMSPEDQRRNVNFGRLAQIGNTLSMRSGLELGSTAQGVNPSGGFAQTSAILPGMTQLGGHIKRELLEGKDVITDGLPIAGIVDDNLIDPSKYSWGSLNNVNDQYTGISSFGMQLLAAALVTGVSVIFGLFAGLFSLLKAGPSLFGSTDKIKGAVAGYPFGASKITTGGSANYSSVSGILSAILSGDFNVWDMLGIARVSYEVDRCIAVGGLAFFGVDAPDATATTMLKKTLTLSTAGSAIESPGYYAVMARSVIRSFITIGDGFLNVGKAFGTGFVAGIKQLLEVIDTIRNSKFIRVLDIFNRLGNEIISMSSNSGGYEYKGSKYKKFLGKTDNSENIDAITKNRLKTTGEINPLTLAWSSYRSPDMFVMPKNILTIRNLTAGKEDTLGTPNMLSTIKSESAGAKGGLKYTGSHVSIDSSRIPTEVREAMEDALETEYLPFYIQDVRTNEIVSFHAFLASLSDGYTASYEPTEGFGRVEAVKTYKSTSRKIDFSFYIVSTNPDDFDYMWLKINKLTTLLYPQFTNGRKLTTADGKYSIQMPFSQTIQASPLVRVRIGDLIRSNYSKFNLARLFGYDSLDTVINGKNMQYTSVPEGKVDSVLMDKQFVKNAIMLPKSPLYKDKCRSDVAPDYSGFLPDGFVLKIVDVLNPYFFMCEVTEATGVDAEHLTQEHKQNLKQYMGDGGDKIFLLGKKYLFARDELTLSKSQMRKIKRTSNTEDQEAYIKEMNEFMDDGVKGNAIAKSFRSSGGRGVAGFIESLSFDWYDKTTWEIRENLSDSIGRRAPKMCKVNVSFSPIHDITPGLDHLGMNRAPVYPVGPYRVNDFRAKKPGVK